MESMATLKQKIGAERRMRELIDDAGLPLPDWVEYGYTCIRLFWTAAKAVIVVDIDEFEHSGSIAAAALNGEIVGAATDPASEQTRRPEQRGKDDADDRDD